MCSIFESSKQTLIIVASPYEIGGGALTGGVMKSKSPAYTWTGTSINGNLTPLFATGPGSEKFNSIMDNTEIYKIIDDIIAKK